MAERDVSPDESLDNDAARLRGPGGLTGPLPDELQSELRRRAQRLLANGDPRAAFVGLDERDMLRLIHELQVHQIEIEMQNEELLRTQVELGVNAERYADLYDFAPIGYLSLNADGSIQQANLTAANQLGMARREIIGTSFHRHVAPADLSHYYSLRRRLVIPELTESAELQLRPIAGEPFWARLEIVTRRNPKDDAVIWQVAISNTDAQKRAELLLQHLNEELEQQVQVRTQELTLSNRQLLAEVDLRAHAEAELRAREEQLEQRVAARTEELATLLTVAREVSATLNVEAILQIVLVELRRIVRYTGCGIFLLHGNLLTLVAYEGPLHPHGLLPSQTTLNESPLLRRVVSSRCPLIVPDVDANDALALDWQEHAGVLQRQLMDQARCWLGIPMIAQGEVIGVLRLDQRTPDYFTEQHADLALILASQAAVAVVNARLYVQVQRVAAVEERQRLARELHDSVAQTFYSIALAAHSARTHLRSDAELVERRLNHVLDLADAGLTEMKALIFDLQAEGIRRDGLVEALRRQVNALAARNDIGITADLGVEPDAALAAKEAIYGIVREAVQNVMRHAAATELSVTLRPSDDRLCAEVRDNGKGFSPEAGGPRTFGMRSMQERASAVGGSVEIQSAPGAGTVVRATVPARTPAAD